MKKRCILFFFYDKDGIVDRYIYHILQDLKERSERIVFVCNGKLSPDSRKTLQTYTEDIIVRRNEGFDVWAYREGLFYLGWGKIREYDELVLMNHTIYPTPYSFAGMFDEMELVNADFWGVTKFFEGQTAVAGLVPDHIQSHFIAVRQPMLSSYEFRNYWEKMPPVNSYQDSVQIHESRFTERFESYGFRSYVYCAAEELRTTTNTPVYWSVKYLLENTRIPLMKRKTFFYPYVGLLHEAAGEISIEAYRCLKKMGYDVGLIWENILRTASLTDIKDALQLNYILPEGRRLCEAKAEPKICAVIYLRAYVSVPQLEDKLGLLPRNTAVHILVPDGNESEIPTVLGKYRVQIHAVDKNKTAGEVALNVLAGLPEEYDYILSLRLNVTDKASFAATYKTLTCLLGSKDYLQNVFNTFEDEQYLGLLFPAPPENNRYAAQTENGWRACSKELSQLAEELHLSYEAGRAPLAPFLGMYWCRGAAMRRLLEKYTELPEEIKGSAGKTYGEQNVLDMAMGLLTQKAGYYSAWLFNEEFAAIELTNKQFYYNKLTREKGVSNK